MLLISLLYKILQLISSFLSLSIYTATCDDLSLTNGAITYDPNSSPRLENAKATHTCTITGYELSGDTVNPRVCQSDRSWSGGDITCQRKVLDLTLLSYNFFYLCCLLIHLYVVAIATVKGS